MYETDDPFHDPETCVACQAEAEAYPWGAALPELEKFDPFAVKEDGPDDGDCEPGPPKDWEPEDSEEPTTEAIRTLDDLLRELDEAEDLDTTEFEEDEWFEVCRLQGPNAELATTLKDRFDYLGDALREIYLEGVLFGQQFPFKDTDKIRENDDHIANDLSIKVVKEIVATRRIIVL